MHLRSVLPLHVTFTFSPVFLNSLSSIFALFVFQVAPILFFRNKIQITTLSDFQHLTATEGFPLPELQLCVAVWGSALPPQVLCPGGSVVREGPGEDWSVVNGWPRKG